MPAALSSPIDPAIGQLLRAARAQGRAGASVLPVLAVGRIRGRAAGFGTGWA